MPDRGPATRLIQLTAKMPETAIRDEQRKLLATAVSALGVAIIVAGVIAPTVGYFYGTFEVGDPLRLLSLLVIYTLSGGKVLRSVRAIMGGLE